MTDPAGLTIGTLALCSLFGNAMACFECVQLGRNFDRDFQTCQIELGDAYLRYTRWGKAVGLSNDSAQSITTLDGRILSSEDARQIEPRLRQIETVFEEAKSVSKGLNHQTPPATANNGAQTNLDDLERGFHGMHEGMENLALNHVPKTKTKLTSKVKWALHDKKHFEDLVKNLNDLINGLTNEFPAGKAIQRRLCAEEAAKLCADGAVERIRAIIANQDPDLDAALARALETPVRVIRLSFR